MTERKKAKPKQQPKSQPSDKTSKQAPPKKGGAGSTPGRTKKGK